jgi:hypothetical protein
MIFAHPGKRFLCILVVALYAFVPPVPTGDQLRRIGGKMNEPETTPGLPGNMEPKIIFRDKDGNYYTVAKRVFLIVSGRGSGNGAERLLGCWGETRDRMFFV